ncbi:MAG: hypothetical protein IDH49_01460 [Gammaproteobacteria bacterium]|nr:hypothetical protein [Gammaproteobacteria bacterium]
MNDEHEKNPAPDASAVFQTLKGLLTPNHLPSNSTRELASPDALEKDPCYTQRRPKRTDADGENRCTSKAQSHRKEITLPTRILHPKLPPRG